VRVPTALKVGTSVAGRNLGIMASARPSMKPAFDGMTKPFASRMMRAALA
jgi:hypothetical protein